MPSLLTPITSLPGIGPALGKKFATLGMTTLEEALFYFPVRHEDWRTRIALKDVRAGAEVTVSGEILGLRSRRSWRRRGLSVSEAKIDDGTATLPVVWFNQPYLSQTLKVGDRVFLSGRVEAKAGGFQMTNPAFEKVSAQPSHQRLVPVYASVDGLSQRQIRRVMKVAVGLANVVPDHVPAPIREQYGLIPRVEALHDIHFPASPEKARAAVRRLQFDELVIWQLRWLTESEAYHRWGAPVFPFNQAVIRSFVQQLPFELTADQRQAAWDILQDLGRSQPMSRLLQADVGAGKTVVAAIAAYNVTHQEGQVAMLVPTVVLARQHFRTLSDLLRSTTTSIALMTGETIETNAGGPMSKRAFLTAVRDGEIQVIVGTQAIIESELPWKNLGLVVVDEQQRFGVAQREALIDLGRRLGRGVPHYLSLTATPIPRTLALTVTGELAITRLRTKPPGRTPIQSRVITSADRSLIDQQLRATVQRHEQAFVVTPLIEESDHFGARAATTEHVRLQKKFPKWKIGLLHGSMTAVDRQTVMGAFAQGLYDILVSTTVIEVGIDVPNATLMIIEGAERFGLAQLHQLRGRVGRSAKPSLCLFVTDRSDETTTKRLTTVAETDDGLALAEADLAERGSGQLYGLRQSGWPDWRLATLEDPELLQQARLAALQIHQQGYETSILMDEEWKTPAGRRHRE